MLSLAGMATYTNTLSGKDTNRFTQGEFSCGDGDEPAGAFGPKWNGMGVGCHTYMEKYSNVDTGPRCVRGALLTTENKCMGHGG